MTRGKRAGTRAKRGFSPALALLALGVTGATVAWGYLVWAAIDFGTDARAGDDGAWRFLALAAAGAVVCLFLALVLLARTLRALGITGPPATDDVVPAAEAPRQTSGGTGGGTPGGRRAAR